MGRQFESKCEGILSEEIDGKQIKGYVASVSSVLSTLEDVYTDFGHSHNPEWLAETLAGMDKGDQYYEGMKSDLENAKKEWPKVKNAFTKAWKAFVAVEAALGELQALEEAGINMQKKSAYLGVGR